MQKIGLFVKGLTEILPHFPPNSDAWKAVHEALGKLVKVMPGPSSPASDKANIEQMAMKQAQNANTLQQMQQGGKPAQMPSMQPQAPEAEAA